MWNLDGSPVASTTRPGIPLWSAAIRPDQRYALVGTWRTEVQVRDAETTALEFSLEGHNAVVYGVAWHPHDLRIAASAAGDGTVKLWDVTERRCLITFTPFEGWDAITVEFSPDGRRLLTAGANGTAVVWDLAYYDRHIAGNRDFHKVHVNDGRIPW